MDELSISIQLVDDEDIIKFVKSKENIQKLQIKLDEFEICESLAEKLRNECGDQTMLSYSGVEMIVD